MKKIWKVWGDLKKVFGKLGKIFGNSIKNPHQQLCCHFPPSGEGLGKPQLITTLKWSFE